MVIKKKEVYFYLTLILFFLCFSVLGGVYIRLRNSKPLEEDVEAALQGESINNPSCNYEVVSGVKNTFLIPADSDYSKVSGFISSYDLQGKILSISSYEKSTWKSLKYTESGVIGTDYKVSKGRAYLVKFKDNSGGVLKVCKTEDIKYDLQTGWNIVSIEKEISASDFIEEMTEKGYRVSSVYKYFSDYYKGFISEEEESYGEDFTLVPSFGYFINVEQELATKIVVYGDSRTGHDEHTKIVDLIINEDPKAVFHTGDLVADGRKESDWEKFDEITSIMIKKTDFYPSLGNHEYNSEFYFNRFELPNNERWYSVVVDEILFIILDSNEDLAFSSTQYNWLLNTLKDNSEYEAKVVVLHHPIFNTGKHLEDEKNLRDKIVPLFEEYGVDVVFSGHDHTYERSESNGIFYIIAGGGGAPLYEQTREREYSKVYKPVYHYVVLEKNIGDAKAYVKDINGTVIDRFDVEF